MLLPSLSGKGYAILWFRARYRRCTAVGRGGGISTAVKVLASGATTGDQARHFEATRR